MSESITRDRLASTEPAIGKDRGYAANEVMQILESLDSGRLDGILRGTAHSHTLGRVRDEFRAALLGPGRHSTARTRARTSGIYDAFEDWVQANMDRFPTATDMERKRNFLVQPCAAPPPADLFVHTNPDYAATLQTLIDKKTAKGEEFSASASQRVGFLVFLLVSRSGLCSLPLLSAALQALERDCWILSDETTFWFNIAAKLDGVVRPRRVLADSTTLAAIVGSRKALRALFLKPDEPSRAKAAEHIAKTAFSDFEAWLLEFRSESHESAPEGLDGFMRSVACRMWLETSPVLASYVRGLLPSASLVESNHAALLGLDLPLNVDTEIRASLRANLEESAGTEPEAATTPEDTEDVLGPETLVDPRRIATLNAIRAALGIGLKVDVAKLRRIRDGLREPSISFAIVDWLVHLSSERLKETGKRRAVGTLRNYIGLIIIRLLSTLPDDSASLDAEELSGIYFDLLGTTASPANRSNVHDHLRRFHQFCVEHHGFPSLVGHFPTSVSGAYDVSARIVPPMAFKQVYDALREEQSLSDKWREHLHARVFVVLTMRFGLRRSEALGLTIADVSSGKRNGLLMIRSNRIRSLKTRNARRNLPLSLLLGREHADLAQLVELSRSAWGDVDPGEAFLFLDPDLASPANLANHPCVPFAKSHLWEATSDEKLHPHHLRHSFATLMLVGTLAADLNPRARKRLPGWIAAAIPAAERYQGACGSTVGPAGFRGTAVSAGLGHGHERTTYENYVHGLDWLAFIALTDIWKHGGSVGVRARGNRHTYAESRMTARLLGLSADSRPRSGSHLDWLCKYASTKKVRVLVLSKLLMHLEDSWVPTLSQLRARSTVAKRPTWMKEKAGLSTARGFLAALSHVQHESSRSSIALLHWLKRHRSPQTWSSFRTRLVDKYRTAAERSLGPFLTLEYRAVKYEPTRRFERLEDTTSRDSWLRRAKGVTHVRLCPPQSVSPAERHRHAEAVAWCIDSIIACVRDAGLDQSPGKSPKAASSSSSRGGLAANVSDRPKAGLRKVL